LAPRTGGQFLLCFVSRLYLASFPDSLQTAVSQVDLFTLRQVVSQYTLDYQRSPRSFSELKIAGYLNCVPPPVDERNVFFQVPEIQDPPLEKLLPNLSDPKTVTAQGELPDPG
jgi:hypothetical protein